MNYPGLFELIKPMRREKEYGFQINWKKPSWSFFAWIDLTKRRSKYEVTEAKNQPLRSTQHEQN